MPRKEFDAFTRLDASDVNTFLMDQSVMTFGGTAARGSAIPTPVEGMVTYLEDSNSLQLWEGSRWTAAAGVSSGNALINGDFDIWQRGTSFTNPGAGVVYTADRWVAFFQGNGTLTQDTSLVPSNSRFGARLTATASSTSNILLQAIETQNAIQFAGQTVTLSGVYAGTVGLTPSIGLSSSTNVNESILNISTDCTVVSSSIPTSTGSFQEFRVTFTVPSTARTLRVALRTGSVVDTNFLTFGRVQLEAGPVATPFRRNAPSIQAELAACQRYYYRSSTLGSDFVIGGGFSSNTTTGLIIVNFPVTMRREITSLDFSNLLLSNGTTYTTAVTSATLQTISLNACRVSAITTATQVANQPTHLFAQSTNGFIGFSAEL